MYRLFLVSFFCFLSACAHVDQSSRAPAQASGAIGEALEFQKACDHFQAPGRKNTEFTSENDGRAFVCKVVHNLDVGAYSQSFTLETLQRFEDACTRDGLSHVTFSSPTGQYISFTCVVRH